MEEKGKKGRMDYTLLLIVVLLVVIGLVILYSTSAYNGQVKFHDSFYYLKKQAFATVLGIVLMLFVAGMDYHIWQRLAVFGYLAAVALSVAVMLFGREINGSKRWLALGPFSFQPSEFAKVALILFLGIGVILIFVASPKYAQFALMGIAGACFMGIFLALESYRLERLAIWRNPEKYEKGYQTLQGLYAIGSGGVFGVGIGNSVQKLGFVPEAQNDMIFSIICEELGLAGAGIIVFLFLLLIWRFFLIASGSRDLFGALIATGAMAHMMIQVILNIAVVTNTIPNTGITLPFISYGGTSVMFLLIEMGLVLSVSQVVD